MIDEAEYSQTNSSSPRITEQKSPILAVFLSFLFMGLGQYYNGNYLKGTLVQVGIIVGGLFIVPGILVWIFSLWDAYNDSQKMNNGELPYFKFTIEAAFKWLLSFICMLVISFIINLVLGGIFSIILLMLGSF